jgi:hypothetical protein
MQTSDDVNNSYSDIANKPIVRVHFCDAQQKYGFINLYRDFIQQLYINSETELTEEIITVNGRQGIFVSQKETI